MVSIMNIFLSIHTAVTFPSEDKPLSKNYGTKHYRSPEVLNRHPRNDIDWMKVDIYAVGVIFFELCWSFEDHQRNHDMVLLRGRGHVTGNGLAKFKSIG